MEFKAFVGIDISKKTIDVAIHQHADTKVFVNSRKGFKEMTNWVKKCRKDPLDEVLFCFEHTGIYSVALSVYLHEIRLCFAQVPALDIKRSMGIVRGKSDKIDAQRIARYAYERRETILPSTLACPKVRKLQVYMTLRTTLVRQRASLEATAKEQRLVYCDKEYQDIFRAYKKVSDTLHKQIEQLQLKMLTIIKSDQDLEQNFRLATSVIGIGQFTVTYILVCTNNFQRFETWRKFACYCGTAPFEYSSGTSIRGKTKVHHFANREIKSLLFMCAMNAIKFDGELRKYYQRRLEQGKCKMSTLNIIKNKLIARIFSAVNRKTPFVKLDMLQG
jgi:transposase